MVFSPSEFLIASLPNENASLTASINGQYAGLLPVTTGVNASNYFFWYFPARASGPEAQRLTIWLNGGPGCSSLEGNFAENGPIEFDNDGNLVANPFSWHQEANLLYVEEPIGTGFDVDRISSKFNLTGLAGYFNTFLNEFATVFPEIKTQDIYITGESYAGQYIPYIATNLVQAQNWTDGTGAINLKGISLGNPLIASFANQQPSDNYNIFKDAGYFDGKGAPVYENATKYVEYCNGLNQTQRNNDHYGCDVAYLISDWAQSTLPTFGVGNTCIDPYNMAFEYPCNATNNPDIIPGSDWQRQLYMTSFFNDPKVQSAIHVADALPSGFHWSLCKTLPHFRTRGNPYGGTLFKGLVDANVKVIVYDGDLDTVVNHYTLERELANTTWAGEVGFQSAPVDWIINTGTSYGAAGKIQKERGVTYIRVFGAGHMVPGDKPAVGLALLRELLIQGGSISPSETGNPGPSQGYGTTTSIPANIYSSATIAMFSAFVAGTFLLFL